MSFCFRLRLTLSTSLRPLRVSPSVRKSSGMAQTSAFANAVFTSMRKLYPEVLADKSWDNTGVLLEAPFHPHHPKKANSVLLTIDLTKAVVDEAIQNNHSVVVAYHPIIFRGLKAITLGDPQQQSLLRLAAHGISVYCPHTAVDIVPGGMADWLCDIITGKLEGPDAQPQSAAQGPSGPAGSDPRSSSKLSQPSGPQRSYSKPNYVPSSSAMYHPDVIAHTRSIITPSPASSIEAANSAHRTGPAPYSSSNTGAGRVVTFEDGQSLGLLISRIAAAVGHPKAFPLAIPQGANIEDISIRTVGLCPGSGSSVVRAATPAPDLVFTGEVSHHDALAIIERGGSIISLFHSNSERGYLDAVMKPKLEAELKREWKRIQGDPNEKVSVAVSHWDRDPFGIVVLEDDQDLDFDPIEEESHGEDVQKSIAPVSSALAAEKSAGTETTSEPASAPAPGPESTKLTPEEPVQRVSSKTPAVMGVDPEVEVPREPHKEPSNSAMAETATSPEAPKDVSNPTGEAEKGSLPDQQIPQDTASEPTKPTAPEVSPISSADAPKETSAVVDATPQQPKQESGDHQAPSTDGVDQQKSSNEASPGDKGDSLSEETAEQPKQVAQTAVGLEPPSQVDSNDKHEETASAPNEPETKDPRESVPDLPKEDTPQPPGKSPEDAPAATVPSSTDNAPMEKREAIDEAALPVAPIEPSKEPAKEAGQSVSTESAQEASETTTTAKKDNAQERSIAPTDLPKSAVTDGPDESSPSKTTSPQASEPAVIQNVASESQATEADQPQKQSMEPPAAPAKIEATKDDSPEQQNSTAQEDAASSLSMPQQASDGKHPALTNTETAAPVSEPHKAEEAEAEEAEAKASNVQASDAQAPAVPDVDGSDSTVAVPHEQPEQPTLAESKEPEVKQLHSKETATKSEG